MRITKVLAILVLATDLMTGAVRAQVSPHEVTVLVTGSGSTIDDAKTDAIRQALQQTLRQLVVVDRVINNDTVIRDKVMSTMNGYIDAFKLKRIQRTSSGFSVDANVTVSASRIVNFIGVSTGGSGTFEGAPLLAEQNRRIAQALAERAQEEARGEILDRVLHGFPASVTNVNVIYLRLSNKDPTKLEVEVELSYKRSFIAALTGTARALASTTFNPVRRTNRMSDIAGLINAASGGSPLSPGKHSAICLGTSQYIQCFQLFPGDYCERCVEKLSNRVYSALGGLGSLSGPPTREALVIFGRFVDGSGRSADRSGNCISGIARPDPRRNGPDGSPLFGKAFIQAFVERFKRQGKNVMVAGFDLSPKYGVITIPTAKVDLQTAKRFIAIGGLATISLGQIGPILTDLVPGPGATKDGCTLLNDAVRYQLLTAETGEPAVNRSFAEQPNSAQGPYRPDQTNRYASIAPNHPYSPQQRPAAATQFGAIAYDAVTHRWGWSRRMPTQVEAEQRAVSGCGAPNCRTILEFPGPVCGAFAASPDGKIGTDASASEEDAKAIAIERCQSAGGTYCKLGVAICNAPYPPAAAYNPHRCWDPFYRRYHPC
jgi:Domain of unknown function (DUF4189)